MPSKREREIWKANWTATIERGANWCSKARVARHPRRAPQEGEIVVSPSQCSSITFSWDCDVACLRGVNRTKCYSPPIEAKIGFAFPDNGGPSSEYLWVRQQFDFATHDRLCCFTFPCDTSIKLKETGITPPMDYTCNEIYLYPILPPWLRDALIGIIELP